MNNITIDIIYIIKIFSVTLFTFKTIIKILAIKDNKLTLKILISAFIISSICYIIEKGFNSVATVLTLNILIAMFLSKIIEIKLGYSILISAVALSLNYIFYMISSVFCYMILKEISLNDYITLIFIITIYYFVEQKLLFKTKKLKKGIIFLNRNKNNDYLDILILNISATISLAFIILSNRGIELKIAIFIYIIIFSIIMFITIQKSLQLYYKQKMLVKDLEETKEELEEKNNKIKELEKEIIKSGKRSHSISHRQKILEHKLEELSMKSEISEMDIKSRIEKIGKDIRKEPVIVLAKTGIVEIDDVLNYMKSECLKKKIDFQLQLSGNIYKMINNYVSKDELEILLADHIKNAIIAIEHSENINKSILVRLGRLDGTYGLYVYDSGIEFDIETFLKLGKKPATTHKDSGGTGMGFMNTFDTLRKHNASFIIEEYGKPVTDNFTKVLKFKFDNKNEFKICTYRKEEIEKQDKEKILKVENLMF